VSVYPASPDQITPEWLNEHCQLGGRVSKVSATTIGEGVGMLGLLGRLSLEYSDGSGPASVIAKLASPHEPVLDLVQNFGFYEREVNFYQHANGNITNIPRSHFAEVNSTGRGFALILEDLSHCRVPDQVAGCSAADATTVMVELAKLHARHWHIDSNPSFDWLSKGNEGKYRDGQAQYALVYEAFLATYGDRLSSHGRRVADLLRTNALPLIDEAIATRPLTLTHMDLRLDNVLFNDAAAAGVSPLYFIDWQLCVQGVGALDVAYFIAWSMDDETRRNNTPELMRIYHRALCDLGTEGYSYDVFEDDVRRSLLMVALMGSFASIAISATNQRGLDLIDAYVMRTYATIDDMRAYEMFPD
jgi:Ecdysteroid kinase-like family